MHPPSHSTLHMDFVNSPSMLINIQGICSLMAEGLHSDYNINFNFSVPDGLIHV